MRKVDIAKTKNIAFLNFVCEGNQKRLGYFSSSKQNYKYVQHVSLWMNWLHPVTLSWDKLLSPVDIDTQIYINISLYEK